MSFAYSQNCIVRIHKTDSIKLEKIENDFYREYLLLIPAKNNHGTEGLINRYRVTPVERIYNEKEIIYDFKSITERRFKKRCLNHNILFLIDNQLYKNIKTFE
ncbi:hypothetical protein D1632_10245 [Chryseobacterium nematophagum]|uniref:Uncharacterized protein n=1 Tax=Chryseobacterium nematophagum TaxID=2305228 RepID=A0A3M7LCL7_9FLAO|nr:hypothetical protein D1632_10245 [Chryseobacterium nematophagum]